jgi:hypothetical protein
VSAGFVGDRESWPVPVLGEFPLSVLDDDGERARVYVPSCAEVTLLGPTVGRQRLVVPIAFATLDQAQRAGNVLARAFEDVAEIQRERPPSRLRCAHRLRLTRFSRVVPKTVICELCGTLWDERPADSEK